MKDNYESIFILGRYNEEEALEIFMSIAEKSYDAWIERIKQRRKQNEAD